MPCEPGSPRSSFAVAAGTALAASRRRTRRRSSSNPAGPPSRRRPRWNPPPGTSSSSRPKGQPAAPAAPAQPGPANPAVLQPNPLPAAKPAEKGDGKVLFDYWFAAAVEGQQIGFLNWTAHEVVKDGKTFWLGVKHQKFTVSRFGQTVSQFGEESTIETPDGKVLGTSMRQRARERTNRSP